MSAAEKCQDCRFWREHHMSTGDCHARAPGLADNGRHPAWPVTSAGDFCGDFALDVERLTRWIQMTGSAR